MLDFAACLSGSDSDSVSSEAEPASVAAVPPTEPTTAGKKSASAQKTALAFVGRGRWGSKAEAHLAAARAREGKARQRAALEKEKRQGLEKYIADNVNGSSERRGGNKFLRKISYATMLTMAFLTAGRSFRVTALLHGVSRSAVTNISYLVASRYMLCQRLVLTMLRRRARSHQPTFAMCRICWDETGESFCLNKMGAGSTGMDKPVTWHVLVARMKLLVAWSHDETYEINIVLPCLVVPSTSADSIWQQLYGHPWHAPIMEGMHEILERAVVGIFHRETDAAAANLRLVVFWESNSTSAVLDSHWLCSLHQLQLVEVAVSASVRCNLISKMYSLTLLLRSSGLWARMLTGLKDVLNSLLQIKPEHVWGPPPRKCRDFSVELSCYWLTHYKRFKQPTGPSHHWLGNREADLDDEGIDIEALVAGDVQAADRGLAEMALTLRQLRQVTWLFK